MAATSSFAQLRVAYSATRNCCDLVIAPTANGRGTVALDTSPASALMVAFGSDRRARDDDALPTDDQSLLARRGWPGSLVLGAEPGSRLWLLARAKHTDDTLRAGASYGDEAVADIETRHGVSVDVSTAWTGPTEMTLTALVDGLRFNLPVAVS